MTAPRVLACTDCGAPVEVYEIPFPWADPSRFKCIPCLDPGHTPEQLGLLDAAPPARTETRPYDPALAAIPY